MRPGARTSSSSSSSWSSRRASSGPTREPLPRRGQPAVLRLEVGDHLRALLALQRARAREVLLGVAQQSRQRGAPRHAIGFEHRDLLGRRVTVGLGADVHVELPRREGRGRRRGRGRCVHRPTSTSPVGIMHLRCWGHTDPVGCFLEEERVVVPLVRQRPDRMAHGDPIPDLPVSPVQKGGGRSDTE